jgi:hypothetical protein
MPHLYHMLEKPHIKSSALLGQAGQASAPQRN